MSQPLIPDLYMFVGNAVINFVKTTKMRKFDHGDVLAKVIHPGFTSEEIQIMRRYADEWLWGLAEPHAAGISRGVAEAASANPKVGATIRKKWTGWYPTSWDMPSVRLNGKRRHGGGAYQGPKFIKGDRVQLHPGTDAWMMGDRYGTVVKQARTGTVAVAMDRSGKTRKVHPERLEIMESAAEVARLLRNQRL